MGGRASVCVSSVLCRCTAVLAVFRFVRVLDYLDALLVMENSGLRPLHTWAGGKINLLAEVANNAKDVTLNEWIDVE